MKPGTARAFASRRRAPMRAPGPESLSLGSLAVAAVIFPLCHTEEKNPHLFDESRQSSEKTDPEYIAKSDAKLLKAYRACRTAAERDDFMKDLTKEDRHALKVKLAEES